MGSVGAKMVAAGDEDSIPDRYVEVGSGTDGLHWSEGAGKGGYNASSQSSTKRYSKRIFSETEVKCEERNQDVQPPTKRYSKRIFSETEVKCEEQNQDVQPSLIIAVCPMHHLQASVAHSPACQAPTASCHLHSQPPLPSP
jgi:hypothetical protein